MIRSKRKSCSTSARCNGALCVRCCPSGYREPDPPASLRLEESRRSTSKGWPGPTELEYPHRPGHGRCCARHKVWEGLDEAIAEVRAWAFEGDHSDAEALAQLRRHKKYRAWLAQSKVCEEQLEARIARKLPKGGADSDARQRGRARAKAVREGVDVTGRHYRDTLKSAEGRPAKRPRRASPKAKPDPRRAR